MHSLIEDFKFHVPGISAGRRWHLIRKRHKCRRREVWLFYCGTVSSASVLVSRVTTGSSAIKSRPWFVQTLQKFSKRLAVPDAPDTRQLSFSLRIDRVFSLFTWTIPTRDVQPCTKIFCEGMVLSTDPKISDLTQLKTDNAYAVLIPCIAFSLLVLTVSV